MKGCTTFLVNMMGTPDSKLVKADPAKLAERYQVDPEWVRMCLVHWRRRG